MCARFALSGRAISILSLVLCSWSGCGHAQPKRSAEVSSALYTRADTNGITVYSPRTSVAANVSENVSLEATHMLDAWTGASIDVVTAATNAIHEVRNEVQAGGSYASEVLAVTGSYRYSTEPDYKSQGAVASVALDLAQHNTQLALTAFGGHDTVGRASDPRFHRPVRSLGARLSLTQVIDTKTLAQLSWETSTLHGYQASPYRFVAIGGRGTCRSSAPDCVPEFVPEDRFRHALVARARRSLASILSAGLEYRFYFDSWDLLSHTVAPDLKLLVGEAGYFELDYRYYGQQRASFYRARYLTEDASHGNFTRDRELSAMYSNRLGLSYVHRASFRNERIALNAALRAGVTRYRYLAFVGLSRVDVLEVTLLLSLSFL